MVPGRRSFIAVNHFFPLFSEFVFDLPIPLPETLNESCQRWPSEQRGLWPTISCSVVIADRNALEPSYIERSRTAAIEQELNLYFGNGASS